MLVLHSYHVGYTWTDEIDRGIHEALRQSGLEIEFSTRYMDTKRVAATRAYFQAMADMLRASYGQTRFDALVASDNDALEFFRRHRDELFPGVPLVFLGINDFTPAMLDGRSDVTGVVENADYLGTVALALKLRPASRSIVVVSDDTTTGVVQRSEFERAAAKMRADIRVRYLSLGDTTLDDLAGQLSRLPADAIVLVLNCSTDRNGATYSLERSVATLTARCPVPAFAVADIRVGSGTVGGLVTSGYSQGHAAAEMVTAILRGGAASSIPVMVRSPNRYVFDDRALLRYGLRSADLPPGSIVLHQPRSILDEYRPQIVGAGVVFALLSAFAVVLAFEVVRRRRVEASLQKSQAALSAVLHSVPQGIFWKDLDSKYLGCNRVFSDAVGLPSPELVAGLSDADLRWPEGAPATYRSEDVEVIRRKVPTRRVEQPLTRADGTTIWIEKTKTPLTDETGRVTGVLGVFDDITERKRAEAEKATLREQLQQAMKMEAVGRLAGGVAHDFNNLLTAICGNIELARTEVQGSGDLASYLEEAAKAADSAVSVTRQLLAFSRKQIIEPRVVSLNQLVSRLERMLVRVIGEDVELRSVLPDDVAPVKVDPTEIEQVLVNLAVNARDAMPKGGTLTLETANVELDEAFCRRHPPVAPGRFVRLAVTDNGLGMSEEVKSHLFEPFFTTKTKGRGTGLGLATIFGTVQQAGGAIDVYSEIGIGSTFKIYLPRADEAAAVPPPEVPAGRRRTGHETVLLVEDDAGVRALGQTILERLGYVVLVARDADGALLLAGQRREPIDLLMTDVVLPRVNGRELARRLVEIHPEARVLFSSGYTENVIAHHGIVEEGLNFIGKPYSIDALDAKLRQILERTDGPPPETGATPA